MARVLQRGKSDVSATRGRKLLIRIQLLRAVAAYCVVAYHCGELFSAHPGFGLGRFSVGDVGVDIFFVISGFIMVHTTSRRSRPGRFMLKRILRIVPLYWAATFIAIGLAAWKPWLLPHAELSWTTILSSLAFVPAFDASGNLSPILFVGWTLNMEMMFYVLFAISLYLPSRYRLIALTSLILAVLAAGFLSPHGSVGRFYTDVIMLDFAAGCFIAQMLNERRVGALFKRLPVWVAAGLSVAGFILVDAGQLGPAAETIGYGLVASFLVLSFAAHDLYVEPASAPVFSALGDASYSAYLLHPFLVAIVGSVITTQLGASPLTAVLILALVFGGTAVASTLSYRFYEMPSNRLLRAWLLPSSTRSGKTAKSRASALRRQFN